ncbi:MAG TPA: hypothetical protein VM492_18740 [Sumerlaeia bacterium]|nr:hypothetical protein [Sumerlaeia bacterium]
MSIAFIGLLLMVSKSYKSMLSMHQAVRYAKAATEKINTEIRLAVAPIQVRDGNGAAAPRGNRAEFSRFGETTVRRLELVSADADFMTPWDNTLVYDPDISVAGNEVVVSRWLAPVDPAGAFSYANATTPLTVRMRVGDPIGDESVARTGVGSQAAEINITVGPRN